MRCFIQIFTKKRRSLNRKDGTITWILWTDLWLITGLYLMRWRESFPLRNSWSSERSSSPCTRIPVMGLNPAEIRWIFRIWPIGITLIFTVNTIIRQTVTSTFTAIWIWKKNWHGWMKNICLILIIWKWIPRSSHRRHLISRQKWMLFILLRKANRIKISPISATMP